VVHVANVPAFLARSVEVSPVDRKNLNRLFPGSAGGTLSERIAHALMTQVIARADAVIDVHSGDAHETLRPWTGFYARFGPPDVVQRSRDMARAFGVDVIVEFPFQPDEPGRWLYTGAAAVAHGKPAFDVEAGGLGRADDATIALVVNGLRSVLRHLKMAPGLPTPAAAPWFVTARRTVTSRRDGVFLPTVAAGAYVTRGALLGRIVDFHGRPVEDVTSPVDGAVLVLLAGPAVNAGDTIATIGVVE